MEEWHRLLKKYSTGQCTEEERIRVEQWLNSHDTADRADLDEEEKTEVKQRMWQHISEHTVNKKNSRNRIVRLGTGRFLAAASIGIAAITFGVSRMKMFSRQPEVISESQGKTAESNFSYESHEARYITRLCRESRTICFDKLLHLRSTLENSFDFSSLTKPNGIHCDLASDGTTLSPNVFYAVHFQSSSNQVIVVTEQELEMFTSDLMRRAVKITRI
jgi:hypothetical protein